MCFLVRYGWYFLLTALFGDLLIPFILAPLYDGYHHTTMTISALGNPQSPVRTAFNLWMLAEGLLFLFSLPSSQQFHSFWRFYSLYYL